MPSPAARGLLAMGLLAWLAACQSMGPTAPFGQPAARPSFSHVGRASWYGRNHQGLTTASGEAFDMRAMTAAHRELPFGTMVRVTNVETGAAVTVRINDRGPYRRDRIIDLSAAAASALDIKEAGTARVRLEVFDSDQTPEARTAAR